MERDTHGLPTHCLEPLLKATIHRSRAFPFSPSHRSGLNFSGESKRSELSCMARCVIETIVYNLVYTISLGQLTYSSRQKVALDCNSRLRDNPGRHAWNRRRKPQCLFNYCQLFNRQRSEVSRRSWTTYQIRQLPNLLPATFANIRLHGIEFLS